MKTPIRIFSYSNSDFQLTEQQRRGYASVNLFKRTDLFEKAVNPIDADFIIFPIAIDGILESSTPEKSLLTFLNSLPYYPQFEEKHIFFSFHDYSEAIDSSSIFFRASVKRSVATATTFALPYVVFDEGTTLDSIEYHSSFVGSTSTNVLRKKLPEILTKAEKLKFFINTVDTFHENLSSSEEKEQRKKLFTDTIHKSLTVCCPKGNGVQSKRFFEVLSMGRIPILISDDVLLPMEEKIDYSKAILRLSEESVFQLENFLAPFFIVNKSQDIIDRFQYARFIWIEYLQPSKWGELIEYTLQKCLQKQAKAFK